MAGELLSHIRVIISFSIILKPQVLGNTMNDIAYQAYVEGKITIITTHNGKSFSVMACSSSYYEQLQIKSNVIISEEKLHSLDSRLQYLRKKREDKMYYQ